MSDTNFYSAKPFISHDAPDENKVRAEVKVVTGYGIPKDIQESDKGKAAKVVFPVDNTKWPSSGWAQVDSNVMKVVREANENEEPLFFRIETLRKKDVDRETPIAELTKGSDNARENAFKSLAAVKREDDENWTISPQAMTRLEEDPAPSGGRSAYDVPLEELQSGQKGSGSHGLSKEAAPYSLSNLDGSLNLGSYAVGVPVGMFSFVATFARDNDFELSEKQMLKIARMLFTVSNKLQVAIYNGELEKPDLNAGSHTRARAILFEVIRTFYPITEDLANDDSELKKWASNILKKSHQLWKWSIKEVENIL